MSAIRVLAAAALAPALLGAAVAPAWAGHPSRDPPLMIADATKQPKIDIYIAAHPHQAMYVSEQVGAAYHQIAAVVLDSEGHRAVMNVGRWRCDRRTRRYVAALTPGGAPVTSFGVRTPSCRRRLSVGMAKRARTGAQVRVVVRDRWRIGELALRFCIDPPTRPRTCRPLRLARDRASLTTRFRAAERGRWRTALHGPGIRVPSEVSVGERPARRSPARAEPKILLSGDSMLQGLDGFLSDRLGTRAQIFRDVVPASGISKPGGINWLQRARDRGRRIKPDATVVFLGANEGFDMTTTAGQILQCCNAEWVTEYARRVRTMMESYSRPARGKVLWLQMPQVGVADRQQLQLLVNATIRRVARSVRGARVVRLDEVFTPGGRYRQFMTYRGRRVRVRENDGIHLTLAGMEIAATKVHAALRSARVVR